MQEISPIAIGERPNSFPERNMIGAGIKWILIGIWRPIQWLLEAMIIPHPGQKYIEESRDRARRLIGHF